MKAITQLITITCIAGALSGCGATLNQNSMIKRIVRSTTLSNGKTLKMGFKQPAPSWQCKTVGSESHNLALEQTEGMASFGGAGERLQNDAVAYADKHKNVNYAYMYLPNQYTVVGINVTVLRKTTITYYQCKFPPAVNHNPF